MRTVPVLLSLILVSSCANPRAQFPVADVFATAETTPVANREDAADDPAIYIHPTDPTKSLIIGTNKQAGLDVYAMNGELIESYAAGRTNNVDVRVTKGADGTTYPIAATEDRTANAIRVFAINADAPSPLTEVSDGVLAVGLDVYGFGLYQSGKIGGLYAFVGSKHGEVRQFLLTQTPKGLFRAELVRTLKLATQVEGIVADDERGVVFIGEEARGLWRFDAEPSGSVDGTLVSAIGIKNPLARPDLEGLAIYKTGPTSGYLIASSQGSNEYVLFDREGEHQYLGAFRIAAGSAHDATSETDGIDVSSGNAGPGMESGVFVAQDGDNAPKNQNFKIVPWSRIESAVFGERGTKP
jgi:3-phytase